ncbi:hypothetical protein FRC03_003884 [Tulasnella sp. 419]|nr:hypothetical protein FRC03_003884 [Tulasnella sp. 419]
MRVFSQLESLMLRGRIGASGDMSLHRALRLKAPLLKKLIIQHFVHDWSRFMATVEHLTHVELHLLRQNRPYLRDMMKVLNAMTSLQSLKVAVASKHHNEESVATYGIPLVFPSLETLTFYFHGNCLELLIWITFFNAPTLKTLDLGLRFPSSAEEDGSLEWHNKRETQLRSFLTNRKLPSVREIRCERRWRLILIECSHLWSTLFIESCDTDLKINTWIQR